MTLAANVSLLLWQDVFQVGEVSRQGRIFPRMSRRHVFLFEKVVVFSKLQEGSGSQQDSRRNSQEGRRAQKEAYVYKAHIPVRVGVAGVWLGMCVCACVNIFTSTCVLCVFTCVVCTRWLTWVSVTQWMDSQWSSI